LKCCKKLQHFFYLLNGLPYFTFKIKRMEQENNSIFGFGIDDLATSHLISIAKWNKFLSIVSLVFYALAILAIVFGGSFFISSFTNLGRTGFSGGADMGVFSGVLIFYAIILVVLLIPNFFRLNFSNKMIKALAAQDQQLLHESLGHFKAYSKFWGILTIIGISFYALMIILVLLGTIMR
jgi:hypothetical protein